MEGTIFFGFVPEEDYTHLLSPDFEERLSTAEGLVAKVRAVPGRRIDVAGFFEFSGAFFLDPNFGVISAFSEIMETIIGQVGVGCGNYVEQFMDALTPALSDARRAVRMSVNNLIVTFANVTGRAQDVLEHLISGYEGQSTNGQIELVEITLKLLEMHVPNPDIFPGIAGLLETAFLTVSIPLHSVATRLLRKMSEIDKAIFDRLPAGHASFLNDAEGFRMPMRYVNTARVPTGVCPRIAKPSDTSAVRKVQRTDELWYKAPPKLAKTGVVFRQPTSATPRRERFAVFAKPFFPPEEPVRDFSEDALRDGGRSMIDDFNELPHRASEPMSVPTLEMRKVGTSEREKRAPVEWEMEGRRQFEPEPEVEPERRIQFEPEPERRIQFEPDKRTSLEPEQVQQPTGTLISRRLVQTAPLLIRVDDDDNVEEVDRDTPEIPFDDRPLPTAGKANMWFDDDFGSPEYTPPERKYVPRPPRRAPPESGGDTQSPRSHRAKVFSHGVSRSPRAKAAVQAAERPARPHSTGPSIDTLMSELVSPEWEAQNAAIMAITELIDTNPKLFNGKIRTLVFELAKIAPSIRSALSRTALTCLVKLSETFGSDFTPFFEATVTDLLQVLLSSKGFITSLAGKCILIILRKVNARKSIDFLAGDHRRRAPPCRAHISMCLDDLCMNCEDPGTLLKAIAAFITDANPEARKHARSALLKLDRKFGNLKDEVTVLMDIGESEKKTMLSALNSAT